MARIAPDSPLFVVETARPLPNPLPEAEGTPLVVRSDVSRCNSTPSLEKLGYGMQA